MMSYFTCTKIRCCILCRYHSLIEALYTSCFVMFCVLLYGPFCHGAHKIDSSTLFTPLFLWTSLPFISSFTTLLLVPCGGLKIARTGILCCHISPVQRSGVVFSVDTIVSLKLCIHRVLWCSVCSCTGHFVMVPINLTCPHCLHHLFFEHFFNLH